jgi:hypothetical protein
LGGIEEGHPVLDGCLEDAVEELVRELLVERGDGRRRCRCLVASSPMMGKWVRIAARTSSTRDAESRAPCFVM